MPFLAGAISLFAVTNIDDLILLALFFGRAHDRWSRVGIVVGQVLGIATIVIAAALVGGAVESVSHRVVAWAGLIPIAIGLYTLWRRPGGEDDEPGRAPAPAPSVLTVATVTVANGADNLGVYAPIFATADRSTVVAYGLVFLALSLLWGGLGHHIATRPRIATLLEYWGHLIYPGVLITLGIVILLTAGR